MNRKGRTRRNTTRATRYWSGEVTRNGNALDLEPGVFRSTSARRIALSLKHSAAISRRRQGSPFQSAMSMLNFYMNRAGRNLPASRRSVLQRVKGELRKAFGHENGGGPNRKTRRI